MPIGNFMVESQFAVLGLTDTLCLHLQIFIYIYTEEILAVARLCVVLRRSVWFP